VHALAKPMAFHGMMQAWMGLCDVSCMNKVLYSAGVLYVTGGIDHACVRVELK
jgi:hypothetical protein